MNNVAWVSTIHFEKILVFELTKTMNNFYLDSAIEY